MVVVALLVLVLTFVAWRVLLKYRRYTPALPSFNTNEMVNLLEGDSLQFRAATKKFFIQNKALFSVQPEEFNTDFLQQRKVALERMRKFVGSGLVSVKDITENTLKFIAAHELFSLIDASATYLFSVHFNLFGGSVLKLGTKRHHDMLLNEIDRVETPGCFALTEFKHGVNSGFFMDTTAIYDPKTQEFVINTPNTGAQKNWISFAANHSVAGVVFAQLIINDKKEGVHAFYVELRDKKTNKVLPGIRIEDVGHKACVNGNDNGRLFFDNVRVPLTNLLDRYSQVAPDGQFTSSIAKIRDRFLVVADQLMSGRMCIGACSVTLSKAMALAGVRYSVKRLQTRLDGTEMSLFQHLTQKRTLLPIVASTYASSFGVNYVKQRYAKQNMPTSDREEVVSLVCAVKAYCTQQSVIHSGVVREKCGGQGLISVNRIAEYNNVAASLVVVEGDSMLLAQKVTKWLLDNLNKSGAVKTVLLNKAKGYLHQLQMQTVTNLCDPSVQAMLFEMREIMLTSELALLLRSAKSSGESILDAWSKKHLDVVVAVHRAFTERLMFTKTQEAIENLAKNSDIRQTLECMRNLFALTCFESDMAWFLTNTVIPRSFSSEVTQQINWICRSITDQQALDLVDGYGFPTELLTAPIAVDDLWVDTMK